MRAYGKIILFGEHVVVYGYPALAAALCAGVECQISKKSSETNSKNIILDFPQLKFKVTQNDSGTIADALRIILNSIPLPHKPCEIIVRSEIPFRAGLGSSAALAVALSKTILSIHEQNWELSRINELAYLIEQIFHGTPSGIDNTVANYGGLCLVADTSKYQLPDFVTQKIFLPKMTAGLLPKFSSAISLIVVNTGKDRDTKKVVEQVRILYQNNPSYYESVFSEIGSFAIKGYQLLQSQKYQEFGELLNLNHQNLQKLNVSCPELDKAWQDARDAGAIGAKLTGAGGGGCLIAFAPNKEKEVMEQLKNKGWNCFLSQIS